MTAQGPCRSSPPLAAALALWAGLVVAGAGASPAGAQEGAAAPPAAEASAAPAGGAEELMRLQDQLRRRSEEALARRKAQQARLDELDAEARAGRRQNDAIERQLEKQRERIAAVKSELEAAERRTREIAEREAGLKQRIAAFLARLETRIAAGIPWKLEDRTQAAREARQLVAEERTSAASALATASRLQKEQEALGRLVESGTIEVESGRGRLAVEGFHLGLLGVIFASDDGSLIGFAAAGDTLEKGLETVRAAPGAAAGYLRCVDILNRRRTPELTDILVPALPVAERGPR